MVKPEDVNTDRCPGCGLPGQYQHESMAGGDLGHYICQTLQCRVQSFIGVLPPKEDE